MPDIMESNIEEVVASVRENLVYNAKDEDLVLAIDNAIEESTDLKQGIDRVGKDNKTMWLKGTLKDLSTLHPRKASITSNRIFTDIETMIPIMTSVMPEPTILGLSDNNLKEVLKKGLGIAYEVKYQIQQKLQQIIRHWVLFRVGILKYRWDKEKGLITEPVLAKKIGMDKRASTKENCEYIWEELEDSLENLQAKFPSKKKDLEAIVGGKEPKTKLRYIEFWGGNGEWVAWKIKNQILDKSKNPNFKYEQAEDNLFKKPEFPYIFLNVFNLGDENGLYDDITLTEECKELQEGATQLERQILDLNEGQKRVWVVSSGAMGEKKSQELVDRTGDLLVYLDKNAPANSLTQVQSGKPDASLFNHLAHILGEIDNVMGIHSTSRGERQAQETFGRAQLLVQSDYGRLDMIVRNIEQVIEEWYNAYLQMLKVYTMEPEVLSDGETEMTLTAEQIPSNIQIMVKKGSTLPTDEVSQAKNAIQLSQFEMIDPVTLFEELGYTNVEKRKEDLFEWLAMTGKIQMPQTAQTAATGQPRASEGQSEEQGEEQLTKLQQILQSPEFQALDPKEQKEYLGRAKEVVKSIKGK